MSDAAKQAQATYNAAADAYDDPALSFWDRFGRRTVEHLGLRPGASVLDACCGAGASAIPAAEVVGPAGRVLGVDLAENLVQRAQAKARSRGLRHAEFRVGDFLETGLPDRSMDAVVCVFGIFFAPDMTGAVRELWRVVLPGGVLAITTWGPGLFEPANSAFWNAVREERPDLHRAFHPWDRLGDPAALARLLEDAGASPVEVVAEEGRHALGSSEDWWTIVLGSGYRGTIERLTAESRERVRRSNMKYLEDRQVRSVEANVVYAVARKT